MFVYQLFINHQNDQKHSQQGRLKDLLNKPNQTKFNHNDILYYFENYRHKYCKQSTMSNKQ